MSNDEIILRATAAHLGIEIDEAASMMMLGALPVFHTYEAWKEAGYQVQKGQKAAFSAVIWKMTHKKDDEGNIFDKLIMKQAYFFGQHQVKPIQ